MSTLKVSQGEDANRLLLAERTSMSPERREAADGLIAPSPHLLVFFMAGKSKFSS